MDRNPTLIDKLWQRTRRHRCGLAFAVLAISSVPSVAQTSDPVTALFSACVAPSLTADDRLSLLTKSGWRHSANVASTRKLLALIEAVAIPLNAPEDAEVVLRAFKTQFERKLFPAATPGSFPILEDVTREFDRGKDFEAVLTTKDGLGLVYLMFTRSEAGIMSVRCGIVLAGPQRAGLGDELIALAGPHETQEKSAKIPTVTAIRVERQADDGQGTVRLRLLDFAADAPHNLLFKEENLDATVSLRVASDYSGFPLR